MWAKQSLAPTWYGMDPRRGQMQLVAISQESDERWRQSKWQSTTRVCCRSNFRNVR
jgi:hypothetical protein